MIEVTNITYTEEQWDKIKAVIHDALGVDADQITHQGLPLRGSIEVAASVYLPQSATNRQRLGREELIALRKDTENLRTRIAGSLVVQIAIDNVVEPQRHEGMLSSTNCYFTKLAPRHRRTSRRDRSPAACCRWEVTRHAPGRPSANERPQSRAMLVPRPPRP
jgi:hypothetical protein